MEAYSQTMGIDERREKERQSENDCETKTLARSRELTRVGANKTKEERIVQIKSFEFRVKVMRGQGKKRSRMRRRSAE